MHSKNISSSPKSIICCTVKKNKYTDQLSKNVWKTTEDVEVAKVHEGRIISMVNKNNFTISNRSQHTYEEADILFKFTIKRGFQEWKTQKVYHEVKTTCYRLDFGRKHLKEPSQFWKILWTDENKMNLYKNDTEYHITFKHDGDVMACAYTFAPLQL